MWEALQGDEACWAKCIGHLYYLQDGFESFHFEKQLRGDLIMKHKHLDKKKDPEQY